MRWILSDKYKVGFYVWEEIVVILGSMIKL